MGIRDDAAILKLEEWINSLSYPHQTNPKEQYAKEIKACIINDSKSIPKQIKKMKGKICVLDAPRHNPDICAINNITTAMRYHLFTEVKALYYDVENNIRKATEKALAKDALFSIFDTKISENEKEENMEEVFSLEDYIDVSGKFLMERIYRQEESVAFVDGSVAQVSGDVLVVNESEEYIKSKIKDVIDCPNTKIIYYTSTEGSDEFNKLLDTYAKFPKGKSVKDYSALWQNALGILCEKFDPSEKERFCKEVGITTSVLNNHLTGKSQFLRKKSLNKVLNRLVTEKLVTEEDAKYVSAARAFMSGNNIKFGQQLKNALLQYKITNEINEFLKPLLKESELSITELEDIFLKLKTIK